MYLEGGLDTLDALASTEVPEHGVLDYTVNQRGSNSARGMDDGVGIRHQRLDAACLEHCQRLNQLSCALGLQGAEVTSARLCWPL